jgi:hypothetical protein
VASYDLTTFPGCSSPIDITALLAAGALTITSAVIFKDGSNFVVQLTYSDASVGYIKIKSSQRVKIGGADNTFATGTEIIWQN